MTTRPAAARSPGAAHSHAPDAPSWRDRAACQYTDPALFFPEGDESAPATAAQADQARGVCLRCPVRTECLSYALAKPEPYGIWGGLTERERASERRRKIPGRTLAGIMADADARYLRRRDKQAAADARAQDTERKQQREDAEMDFLLGRVA